MPITAGIIAAPIIMGVIGGAASAGDRRRAMDAARDAAAQYNGIIPPEVKQLIIENIQAQGIYSPDLEQAISAGKTDFSDIQEDAGLKSAQMDALDMMRGRARTGITPEDRAALNQIRNEGQRDIQAKNQQIMQGMQSRGLGGGGAELAMMLQNSQSGADRASSEADRLGALVSQNALQAMARSSDMAGQLQSQGLGLATNKATAADQMKRFDIDTQMGSQQRNVAYANQSQMQNLAEKQRISEANIQRQQAEQERQEIAKQSLFANKMDLAKSKANALTGMASNYRDQANATAKMYAGMGSAIGSGLGSYQTDQLTRDTNAATRDTNATNLSLGQMALFQSMQQPRTVAAPSKTKV